MQPNEKWLSPRPLPLLAGEYECAQPLSGRDLKIILIQRGISKRLSEADDQSSAGFSRCAKVQVRMVNMEFGSLADASQLKVSSLETFTCRWIMYGNLDAVPCGVRLRLYLHSSTDDELRAHVW